MVVQWEYKIIKERGWTRRFQDADGVDYGQLDQALLNRLGKEGWEVCSCNFPPFRPILIVKRKIVPS